MSSLVSKKKCHVRSLKWNLVLKPYAPATNLASTSQSVSNPNIIRTDDALHLAKVESGGEHFM